MAWTTQPLEQGQHHALIQSRLHPGTLFLPPLVLDKQAIVSHPSKESRESNPLDLIHSEVCGPMPDQSLGGVSYFITLIDDTTRKVWAYTAWTKDRVFTIFSKWLAMVKNLTD